ncbi:hypothetical protein ACLMJK_007788 [Lecanora helva]
MSYSPESAHKRTTRFSAVDLKNVEVSENKQLGFRDWVARSKGFSESEKSATNVTSVPAFEEYWRQMDTAKDGFERRQEKGCGLWAKSYQSSAEQMQPFLTEFSPIVQIVKDFGAPYGGLAVGTVSLLFAVAWNKSEMEKNLASTIVSIRNRLPGLKLYEHIYNENQELDIALQSRIVSAYASFLDFCMMATRYYKTRGPRQWFGALSPINKFAAQANEVQDHIVQIRLLCEELLDKNVDAIKRSNMRLREDNDSLKAQLKELQEGQDHEFLAEVQRLLSLEDHSAHKHRKEWDEHSRAVERDDNLNAEVFQQMQGPELGLFKASDIFQSWMHSEQSSLLILSGYNHEAIVHINHCWLSPIAAATVHHFDQQDEPPVHAYCVLPQSGQLLDKVIPILLLQLLRQRSDVLRHRHRHAELRAELKKLSSHESTDYDDRTAAVERVALSIVDFFDEVETIYMIVDRTDRCRDPKVIDHRKALLQILIAMVEAARCKLKILCVVDGRSWPVEDYQDELGVKTKERLIIHTLVQNIRDD